MARQRNWWVAGGLLLAVAGVVLFVRGPEPLRAEAPAVEKPFGEKAAVAVFMKSQATHVEYLDKASVQKMGDRTFITGRRLTGPAWVWLPVSDVAFVEEFGSAEELGKVYRVPAPPAKP